MKNRSAYEIEAIWAAITFDKMHAGRPLDGDAANVRLWEVAKQWREYLVSIAKDLR